MKNVDTENFKKYMIVKNNQAPVFLKGVLHEYFDEAKYNEGMAYNWNRPYYNKEEAFPEELWLITISKIDFDYYKNFFGHIVEESFLNLINLADSLQDYVIAKLNVVDTKGKLKTKKNYYFIKCFNGVSLVDYNKSEFIRREVPENRIFKSEGVFVEKYEKIVFHNTSLDLFWLSDLKLGSYMFCSENFKNNCIAQNLKGFDFIEIDYVPRYLNSL